MFASGRGLAGALLSTYEGIQPVGLDGGHLRGLYADFLDEAAALLEEPALSEAAAPRGARPRRAGRRWRTRRCPLGRLRELLAEVHGTVVEGGDAAAAAAELWELRRSLDAEAPVDPGELFPDDGRAVGGDLRGGGGGAGTPALREAGSRPARAEWSLVHLCGNKVTTRPVPGPISRPHPAQLTF